MDYKIIRSNRKTIAIHVTKDGSVQVRCPKSVSDAHIKKIVSSKQNWINKKVSLINNRNNIKVTFELKPGSKLRFLGKYYPIAEVNMDKAGFDGKYFYIPYRLPKDEIKPCIIKLYKMLAEKILINKTIDFAKIMNVMPSDIKITSAKTRWGSCSGKNSINYSWKLIMADEDTVDYVVFHELAHIKEHNHSNKFWAIVEKYIPDYKHHISILKNLANELAKEDWDM